MNLLQDLLGLFKRNKFVSAPKLNDFIPIGIDKGKAPGVDSVEKPELRIVRLSKLKTLIGGGGPGYTVYTALITQTGTADPVATLLQNTTGKTFTYGRTDVGVYTLTSSAAIFTANKTIIFINAGASNMLITGERTSDTVLTVKTFVPSSGAAADAAITNGAFEIRIYS